MGSGKLTKKMAAVTAAAQHGAFWEFIRACSRTLRYAGIHYDPFEATFVVTATAAGRAPIVVRSPDVVGNLVAAAGAIDDQITAAPPEGPLTDARISAIHGELARLRSAYAQVEGMAAIRLDNPIVRLIAISETLLAEVKRARSA